MAGKLITYLLTAVFIIGLSTPQAMAKNHHSHQENQTLGPRKQLITIIFSGLTGATLGLSTLSFYKRPQDRLSNIAIGFALGVITGTIYTTYQTAAASKNYYKTTLPQVEREQMLAHQQIMFPEQVVPQLQLLSWEWDF